MHHVKNVISTCELEEIYANRIYDETGEYPSAMEIYNDPNFQVRYYQHYGPELISRKLAQSFDEFITENQFIKAYQGACLANRQGIVFNAQLTINFKNVGIISDEAVEECSRKFWQCFQKRDQTKAVCAAKIEPFLNRRSPYITVFERDGAGGLHSHSAMAIPPGDSRNARDWMNNYFMRLNGNKDLPEGTINLVVREHFTVANQWGWFVYMLKTLVPGLPWSEGKGFHFRSGGKMNLKRVVISESIGQAEQKRWNYDFWRRGVPISKSDLWTPRHYENYRSQTVADLIRNIDKMEGEGLRSSSIFDSSFTRRSIFR